MFSFCTLSYLCCFVYYREHWESSHTGDFLCEQLELLTQTEAVLERNKTDILGAHSVTIYPGILKELRYYKARHYMVGKLLLKSILFINILGGFKSVQVNLYQENRL